MTMQTSRFVTSWISILTAIAFSSACVADDVALKELHKIRIPGATLSIDWHPNSKIVALGGFAGMLVVVDAAKGEVQDLKEDREVRAVKFSPDGRFLAVGKSFNKAQETFVKLLDTERYETRHEIKAPVAGPQSRFNSVASISSISFDSDSKLMAVAGYQSESEAAVYQLEYLGRGPVAVFAKRNAAVDFVSFQPGSDALAVGRVPGEIELFSVSAGRLQKAIQAFDGLWSLKLLAFDPNGQMLYAASDTGAQRGWLDRQTGQWQEKTNDNPLKRWKTGNYESIEGVVLPQGGVGSVAVTPDGKIAFVGTLIGKIAMIDIATGKTFWIPATRKTAIKLAVSPDGKLLASVGMGDRYLYIWKIVKSN